MSVIPAIGWMAALCSAVIALPQAIRFVRSRSSAGVSVLIWQTTVVGSLCWTAHGLTEGVVQIFLPNAILGVTAVAVLGQLSRMRGLAAAGVWMLPLVWTAASVTVDLAFGPFWFAAAVFIPTALGLLSQWREILRASDVGGVSVTGLAINLICQSLWLVYAIPSGEVAVISVATPVVLLIVGTLGTLLIRRREQAGIETAELTVAA
ncbi:PQ-loop domain-containing transporter [Nakamurella panacisegetis]|uniref:PQ-loop domain-containing transporter n=1 Tax=Nakamurella panacisegetis TaxID=1090615 RepID=UPI0012FD31FE|nr:PQ-loop domain-containing transporter [Nakamurella panacisegetis]